MSDDTQQNPLIANAIENPDVPKIYFNGFVTGTTTADVVLILQNNGRPCAVLQSSHTNAKTLAIALTQLIHGVEEQASVTFPTSMDLANSRPGSGE